MSRPPRREPHPIGSTPGASYGFAITIAILHFQGGRRPPWSRPHRSSDLQWRQIRVQ